MDGRMDDGMDGGMDGRMDGGWTVGWTVGGRWVDAVWTVSKNFGTGWSRKVDGMVTEGGRDGHGRWTGWSRKVDGKRSKSKDLLYLNRLYF
jgi:hypothetical protein